MSAWVKARVCIVTHMYKETHMLYVNLLDRTMDKEEQLLGQDLRL